jgi:hypothetical protein
VDYHCSFDLLCPNDRHVLTSLFFLPFLFRWFMCLSVLPVPHSFDYGSFIVNSVSPPTLLPFRIVLGYSGSLRFHMNFRMGSFLLLQKLSIGILIGLH